MAAVVLEVLSEYRIHDELGYFVMDKLRKAIAKIFREPDVIDQVLTYMYISHHPQAVGRFFASGSYRRPVLHEIYFKSNIVTETCQADKLGLISHSVSTVQSQLSRHSVSKATAGNSQSDRIQCGEGPDLG